MITRESPDSNGMRKTTVAFQGEHGAFSEVAARDLLGIGIRPKPCESFDGVFDAVSRGKARYGVIPIENSLIGSIHVNYDHLLDNDLTIISETQVRVVHCLIAPSGVTLRDISRVMSHPVALDQCRSFFKKHARLSAVPHYDTAGAVKTLAQTMEDGTGAIASAYAADYYGLRVLKRSIEDNKRNFTRFLLLAGQPRRFSGAAKTSLVFSLKDQPGALFKALSVFALREINMTKIESRPRRGREWRYHFYMDIEGNPRDANIGNALTHLREIAPFVRVLGTYPLAVTGG